MDRHGGTECWDRWPDGQQTAASARAWEKSLGSAERESLAKTRTFFAYVQWVAYGQWEAVKKHAGERGVALMGDIPLGVSYYSADYFGHPELFEQGWSGGAPPEPYFKDDPFTQKWGQNWGIPVYDWAAMGRDDYAWWRQRVGGVRGIFHVFRIDHILGFYRIYSFPWRPEKNAEFLPLSADEARARAPGGVCRSSNRWETIPGSSGRRTAPPARCCCASCWRPPARPASSGKTRGTVPDYVRPNLTALGIAGFKIPIWEPDPRTGGLLPGHELRPPLAGHLRHA